MFKFSQKLIVITLVLAGLTLAVSGCVPKRPVNQNTNTATTTSEIDPATRIKLEQELAPLFNDPSITSFKITKYEDNFVMGTAGVENASGFVWIAKKSINQGWELIFQGQDYMRCDLLLKHEAPLAIYAGYCVADNGRDLLIYREIINK